MAQRHAAVDLESYVGTTHDRVQFRAARGAEHNRVVVKDVVDEKDGRFAVDNESEPTDKAMARV